MPTTCFVSYEIHPTTAGGCGVLIHHAAEVLLARGEDVVLLLDMPREYFRRFVDQDRMSLARPEGLRAYLVDDLCEGFPHRDDEIPCIFQRKSLRFAFALRGLLEREAIDFVEFFEYCGPGYYAFVHKLFAEAGNRAVLGCRIHGSIEVLDRFGDGVVRDAGQFTQHGIERRAFSLAEAVLTPTLTYYDRYYTPLYGTGGSAVVVSTPPKQAFPAVSRRPTGDGPFTIAFVGRMFHLKGVDQLVHAAVMLMKERPGSNFAVDLIGYDSVDGPLGSYTAYLRTLIPEPLRERFQFAGQLRHEDIAARLERALFAVFPNRIESFCYALHEIYDAGVPVIINDLPAFRDFFTHERNALVYDGTTTGLLKEMRRLIDDPALRAAVTKPYSVAETPLGDFYARPEPLAPLHTPSQHLPSVTPTLALVLDRADTGDTIAAKSLRQHTDAADCRVVVLSPARPDHEETLWLFGSAWHARDAHGAAIEPSGLFTTETLTVLEGGDEPEEGWLRAARRALQRRHTIGFAGTWSRVGGTLCPGTLDLTPELYPFTNGARLPRVVVRTRPGLLLGDAFDPSLGELGPLGLVWRAIAEHGHGVLLPEVLLHEQPGPNHAADAEAVAGLLLRYGQAFSDRLGLAAGFLRVPGAPTAAPAAALPAIVSPSVGEKIALADELGGRTLARLAWKKLARRVTGQPESRQ